MTTTKVGKCRFTNVSHHPFSPFSIGTINFKTMGYWLLFNQNFALTYKWISSLFSPLLSLTNFNADVAITMKMLDIVMSTQGGRGFASFVGTINLLAFRDKQPILNRTRRGNMLLKSVHVPWQEMPISKLLIWKTQNGTVHRILREVLLYPGFVNQIWGLYFCYSWTCWLCKRCVASYF